jgi:AI-2 transport protein TqsA
VNVLFRSTLMKLSGNFFGFLSAAFVVLVYLFFLLLEFGEIRDRVQEAFGDRSSGVMDVAERINNAVGDYLSVIAFVSLLQGALSAVVLGVLQVDFFLLWGLLIGLFNLIPYLGALVGLAPPVVLAFIQYPDQPWRPLTVLVLLLGIQGVVDNFLTPRLTGHKMGVSPLLVVLSLAFWGWLWGIVGLILAVPLTVAIKIILEQMEATKPIAILMKDR